MNTTQSHGTGVPAMIGSLSEPDILASQQYYDNETSGRQPERSLMFAVLLDAVECFQKYALLDDEYENRLFREAENWILATIGNGSFRSSISAKLWQLIRIICVKVSCVGSKTRSSWPQERAGTNAPRESHDYRIATIQQFILQ